MPEKSKVKSNRGFIKSAQIRQTFLDFFKERGHTIVPSMSLVPGGDETLLFTNSGMVQFKDVFLGTGKRDYSRVADSQKCMRVAGKHNDLDDVGRDDTHHTFFEMLGNWSFGDYYKKEAIEWAWELLTDVWDLPRERLYATCFEDELGEIPRDDEAADYWRAQPGFEPDHVLFFGRDENFWEMAETGPCGPDSEIHLDQGQEFCDKQDLPGHECRVNGDCARFLELWNLVFIQYNRQDPKTLDPLPKKHVDTGLGFERIVSVLQNSDSNYKTDLFTPIMEKIQQLAGHSEADIHKHWTPYRVLADHGRGAAFLIADGVVPGNIGRNYVTRMIIRRASLFGSKIGFTSPFLAEIAETVIREYGEAYPELIKNRDAILSTLTLEEERFQKTVDIGIAHLNEALEEIQAEGSPVLSGPRAFELYATYGLPLEITRDLSLDQGIDVEVEGFQKAMEAHRIRSKSQVLFDDETGGGLSQSEITNLFQGILEDLTQRGLLGSEGVQYDPYTGYETEGPILGLIKEGKSVLKVDQGEVVAVILPETHFYVESGGQVSDTGSIVSVEEPRWEIEVFDMKIPVSGMILHMGKVRSGKPKVGEQAIATVDHSRRMDIMRNHTATHLMHAALREVVGQHARQAGSLVAPDRLRFDFTHAEALTHDQVEQVEQLVNEAVLSNYDLFINFKPVEEAIAEGAMALFGETYGDVVRTISIGDRDRISYELCGGTHVPETGIIGTFLITSESSVAAGIRRIEAITGRGALDLIRDRRDSILQIANKLGVPQNEVLARIETVMTEMDDLSAQLGELRNRLAFFHFERLEPTTVGGVPVISAIIPNAGPETLRLLADRFRQRNSSGVLVLASTSGNRPIIIAAITEDLVAQGLQANKLVEVVAKVVGGGGGGKPTLAQAGGKDVEMLPKALERVPNWVEEQLR